jgi:hypothetical protein
LRLITRKRGIFMYIYISDNSSDHFISLNSFQTTKH